MVRRARTAFVPRIASGRDRDRDRAV